MNIAYHCTDNYARITATSIISVFKNNQEVDEINVYIIENGFTAETKKRFEELAEQYNRKIYFIPLPDLNKEYGLGLVSIKKKWMFDSYSRLFLSELLPENVEKVLYLDGDILVVDSLYALWNMNLEGKCCAACLDCVSEGYYNLFGMNTKSKYCNSGVILIDLKEWRKKQIVQKVKQYVRENNGYVFFMEQTVFNVVLQNEIDYLPAKYNVSTLEQVLSYRELMILRKPLHYYREFEVRQALLEPVIVHMTGFFYVVNRAWNEVTNHPEKERFIEYSKLLKWDDEVLQKDGRNKSTRIKDMIIHAIPKVILIWCVSFVYNYLRIMNISRISKKNKKEDLIVDVV